MFESHIKTNTRVLSTTALVSLVLLANCDEADETDEPTASATDDKSFRAGGGGGGGGGGAGCGECPDVPLTGDAPITITGTNIGAGDDEEPVCTGGVGGEDVTFTWVVPADGAYQFDTIGSDYDTTLTIQEGLCVAGSSLACDDDSGGFPASLVTLDLVMGQELTIIVDGYDASSLGNYSVNITNTTTSVCPVANDLGSSVPTQVTGILPDLPSGLTGSCAGNGPEMAFAWTAPYDGHFTFDTANSTFDTVLYLRDADCSGQELGCSDDTVDLTSEVSVDLVMGEVVYIVLDAYAPGGGDYMLNISEGNVAGSGDCCYSHSGISCQDSGISACVCAIDSFCCNMQWDELCAMESVSDCSATC